MHRILPIGVLTLAFALTAAPAHAQGLERNTSISVSPLHIVFSVFAGEIERAVSPVMSVGVSSSYWSSSDDDVDFDPTYFSMDGKVRYYPSGVALKGFALGGTLGYTRLSGNFTTDDGDLTESGTALSMGVILDYTWFLGATENFLVGTGIGAKRLSPRGFDDGGVMMAYPTMRLSVGYAF